MVKVTCSFALMRDLPVRLLMWMLRGLLQLKQVAEYVFNYLH